MLPAAEDQTDAVGGCDQRANSGIETTPESLPGMNRQVGSVESFGTVGDGARAAQIGKASAWMGGTAFVLRAAAAKLGVA
jgi:hypothetical protein